MTEPGIHPLTEFYDDTNLQRIVTKYGIKLPTKASVIHTHRHGSDEFSRSFASETNRSSTHVILNEQPLNVVMFLDDDYSDPMQAYNFLAYPEESLGASLRLKARRLLSRIDKKLDG